MNMAHHLQSIDSIAWLGIREPFSSLSHLLGAILFTVLAVRLIRQAQGDWIRTSGVAVFSVCGVIQLLMSGLYHMQWPGPTRDLMLRADVASIFLLIAGSMTPVHAILFKGIQRWGALAAIWGIAIGGIVWRTLFCDLNPGQMGVAFFLVCGWSCSVTAHVLHRRFGWSFIQPVVMSGLAYTIGAIGLVTQWPDPIPGVIGPHEFWHLAVLAGLILHWYFVSQFASGSPVQKLVLIEESVLPAESFAPIPVTVPLEVGPVAGYERR